MTSKEILTEFANKSIEIIQKNMDRLNANATGDGSNSLNAKYVLNEKFEGIEVWGERYLEAVEFGRKPTPKGTSAGSPTLVEAIKRWIAAKGLDLNPYAVAKNIHKFGTVQYARQKRRGLIEGVFDENRVAQLLKDLGRSELEKIQGEFLKEVQYEFNRQ